ncbi:hypothetical protein B0A48_15380 [Cryoendolithus antarcticus]|uniref:Uncharacterized protein n=1 Tax=Cryoendolithus antarcticus TaxID=1507870 RepID=A0A1V8SHT5_9PEZI|nr:hypothetical protein B0A48_15380 [Cryoendolithus antarcticus]
MDDRLKLTEMEHKTKAKIEETLQTLNADMEAPVLDEEAIQYIATHTARLIQQARRITIDRKSPFVWSNHVEEALQSMAASAHGDTSNVTVDKEQSGIDKVKIQSMQGSACLALRQQILANARVTLVGKSSKGNFELVLRSAGADAAVTALVVSDAEDPKHCMVLVKGKACHSDFAAMQSADEVLKHAVVERFV